MTRLPTPGADNGNWGDILNAFLEVSLTSDGALNSNIVGTSQIQNNAVTAAQLDNITQTSLAKATSAVQSINGKTGAAVSLTASDISAIPSTQLGAASGVATLDSDSKLNTAQLPSAVVSASSAGGTPAWITGTDYTLNNLVSFAGTTYICNTAHIAAATFATDATNWTKVGGDAFSPKGTVLTPGAGTPFPYTLNSAASVLGGGAYVFAGTETFTPTSGGVLLKPVGANAPFVAFNLNWPLPSDVTGVTGVFYPGTVSPGMSGTSLVNLVNSTSYPGAYVVRPPSPNVSSSSANLVEFIMTTPLVVGTTYTLIWVASGGTNGEVIPYPPELYQFFQSIGTLTAPQPYKPGERVYVGNDGQSLVTRPNPGPWLSLTLHPQSNGSLLGPAGYDNPSVLIYPNEAEYRGFAQAAFGTLSTPGLFFSFCEHTPAGGHFGPQIIWSAEGLSSCSIAVTWRLGLM
jgi:hypothetical protein